MANRVGQQFGDYRLTRFLGRGSFGEVYLGEHIHDNTLAAIKVLQARLTPEDLKEFINEVSTTFRLQHPNIVRLLDFGIDADDTPFLAMDYAPNGTLRQRHPKGTRLPLDAIVTYIKQIATALQYAHDKRRIHRDVKPENILLGPNDEVLLSDFGIASVAHGTQSLNTQKEAGSVPYMAPEQLQGKPRPASDQYALGIIVYEWLCGERPFNSAYWEMASQHLSTPPPSFKKDLKIPPEVEQVVMTALAKDPHHRFASIQAFANALVQARQPKPPIGTTLLTYRGQASSVRAVVWSPDGSRIASDSDDRTVHVWNATTGTILLTYDDSGRINAVAWSPDGKHIATASNVGTVEVWSTATGDNLLSFEGHYSHDPYDDSGRIHAVAWSPDGMHIASGGSDGTVHVWNVITESTPLIYGSYSIGHPTTVVAWSPDGMHIASSSNEDGTVQIWDTTTGAKLLGRDRHAGSVRTVAWSPDGKRIASAETEWLSEEELCDSESEWHFFEEGIGTVRIWDAITGATLLTYHGHSSYVQAVAWSPDGKCIASCSDDGTVQVWDATTGNHLFTYSDHTGGVNAVAWSPDGTRIASAGYGVQVWQAM